MKSRSDLKNAQVGLTHPKFRYSEFALSPTLRLLRTRWRAGWAETGALNSPPASLPELLPAGFEPPLRVEPPPSGWVRQHPELHGDILSELPTQGWPSAGCRREYGRRFLLS